MAKFRNDLTADELQRSMAGVFELAQGEVTCSSADTNYTYTIQDARTRFLILIAQTNSARYNLLAATSATSNYLPADTPWKVYAPMEINDPEGPEGLGREMWDPAGLNINLRSETAGTKVTVIEVL